MVCLPFPQGPAGTGFSAMMEPPQNRKIKAQGTEGQESNLIDQASLKTGIKSWRVRPSGREVPKSAANFFFPVPDPANAPLAACDKGFAQGAIGLAPLNAVTLQPYPVFAE